MQNTQVLVRRSIPYLKEGSFPYALMARVTSQLVEEPLLREIWRLFPSFIAVALDGLVLWVQALVGQIVMSIN